MIESTEAGEACIDEPQLVSCRPCHLVNVDVAGDVDTSGEVASIVLATWSQLVSDRRNVAEIPDGLRAADREAIALYGDAHGFLEVAEVGVDHAAVVAYQNGFTGLVRGDDEANVELFEDLGEIGSVDAT